MQSVTLNNGLQMPLLGFGTLQITDDVLCEKCVYEAIETGYRMFDTAASYFNEAAIGRAIKRAVRDQIVTREELFLTTKLWVQDAGYHTARKAAQLSMEKLGTEYLDLYLIHQPYGDYYGAYRAMEEMVEEGVLKSIGVCNFSREKLVDLCLHNKQYPAVNQLEIHPFFIQKEMLSTMKEYQIQPQAWGPLSEGQKDIFHHPVLANIGEKYEKSAAQVVLRWHLQRGISMIPKTVHKERMAENMDIWDFQLSKEDIDSIEGLDIGHSEIIDFSHPCTAKWFHQWKIHEEEKEK